MLKWFPLLLVLSIFTTNFAHSAACPASSATTTAGNGTCDVTGTQSTIQLNFNSGFDDSTSISAVGGNNGTTVGAQRKLSFIKAAEILADDVASGVTIIVDADFSSLTCDASSAVLGSAGATTNTGNVSPAPPDMIVNTFYPIGLINAMGNQDYQGGLSDVTAQFNKDIGTAGCLQSSNGWYYGYDAPPANYIGFTTVLLHEITHGLGFASLVNPSTGAKASGLDDIFSNNLYDNANSRNWNDASETNGNRATSAVSGTGLLWSGNNVNTQAIGLLTDGFQDNDSSGTFTAGDRVEMYAPNPVESGSSVSHFNTDASPNELMEPQYTEGSLDIGLALYLLEDIGWDISSNTVPTITAVDQSTNEDVANIVDASGWGSDGDGDSLTYSITSCPTNITCAIDNDGQNLTLTPDANYNGATNTVTIQVDDGNGGVASDNFNLNVISVNDAAPVWTSLPNLNKSVGDSFNVNLVASDVDSDPITYALVSCDAALTCDLPGGSSSLSIDVDSGAGSTVSVTVSASDGIATAVNETFDIVISAAVNTAPTLNAIDQSTDEDTPKIVDASSWGLDADGDSLTYSVSNCPSNLTCSVDTNGQNLTLTPAQDFNGSIAGIEITVDDGSSGIASDTFNLTVNAINDAPVLAALSNVSMTLGSTESINLSATDVDDSSLSYSVSGSSNAGASISGSTLTLNPIAAGTYSLDVSVTDGDLTDTESIQVTVVGAPSLALNGTALDNSTPVTIDNNEVSLLLADGVSNYNITLTFEGQSASSLLSLSGTSVDIALPAASDFNGQFAGEYVLTLTQSASGAVSEYSLMRAPRLVTSAAKLMGNTNSQTLTIEGGAAGTVYTLSNDTGDIGFIANSSSVTTATALDESANFNPATVILDIEAVTQLTTNILSADSIFVTGQAERDIYPQSMFELTIEDSQGNRLTDSSATVQSPDLADFNVASTFESNALGVIIMGLPNLSEDITVNVAQLLFTAQYVVLVTSQLEQTVVLAKIATPLTLKGDIEALTPLDFGQSLPVITLNLEDNIQVDIQAVKISNSLARFDYVHDLNEGNVDTLLIEHDEGVGLSFNIPNLPGEVLFDIFLEASAQSPALNNDDATEIGSSSGGGTLLWILLGSLFMIQRRRLRR